MKAILVIDEMPKNCSECKRNVDGVCGACGELVYSIVCPLKPLPQKKMPKSGEAYPQSMVLIDRWRGYDECINDILGESNESNTGD